MTREQLEKSLAKIGWRIRKSGNGLNDFIITDEDEATDMVAYGDSLEIRADIFGKTSFKGGIHLEFSGITIKEGSSVKGNELEKDDEVTYVCLSFNDKCFINLYKKRK